MEKLLNEEVIAQPVVEVPAEEFAQLGELHLALVGGGIGETVL